MAYNFLCETTIKPNWEKINKLLKKCNQLESFPFLESSDKNFGLAISIPMKNVGISAYKQFVHIQKVLTKKFGFIVYDMYYGKEVDKKHIKVIKGEIT